MNFASNSLYQTGYCLRHNEDMYFVLNQCAFICDKCWKEDCIRLYKESNK
jgi:hypothetical protein